MKIVKLIFTLLIITSGSLIAQENTVKDQFQELYKNSNNYQIYKVVKKDGFLKLQRNTLDSISTIKKLSSSKDEIIKKHTATIISLKANIIKLNESLSLSKSKEANISLLGLQLSKTNYNLILWGLISILLFSLLFFIYKFKNSNLITNEAKETLIEVEQNLEQYKKKALEKEQKLRRQLQDEINKQRGV
mgnify:CR=1 FL=1